LTQTPPEQDRLGERLTVARVVRPNPSLLAMLEGYDFEAFGETGLRTYDVAVVAKAGLVLAAYLGGRA
jgi:hypothetical protein